MTPLVGGPPLQAKDMVREALLPMRGTLRPIVAVALAPAPLIFIRRGRKEVAGKKEMARARSRNREHLHNAAVVSSSSSFLLEDGFSWCERVYVNSRLFYLDGVSRRLHDNGLQRLS